MKDQPAGLNDVLDDDLSESSVDMSLINEDDDNSGAINLKIRPLYQRKTNTRRKWFFLLFIAVVYFTNIHRTLFVITQFIFGSAIPPYHWEGGHKHIMELMKCTAKIADDMRLHWWLDEGTLLGSVREKDMIKRDSDIDIAFVEHEKHLFPRFRQRMADECGMHVMTREENKGYSSLTSFTIHRVAMRVFSARVAPPWFIDIREYEVDNDGTVYDQDFIEDNDTPYLPLDHFYPLSECTLRGLPMKCPKDSVTVIEDLFGDQWRVPMPGFKTYMLQREATYKLTSAFPSQ